MIHKIFWILGLMIPALAGCSGSAAVKGATEETEKSDSISAMFTADADTLYSLVEAQVNFGPRTPGSAGAAKCADFIASRLAQAQVDTVINHRFDAVTWRGERFGGRNILGKINPGAKDRTLLLAHYDTRPWADNDSDPAAHSVPVDGANDGASGVAVLLEIARHLGSSLPDSVGVDLLFVDLEDSGESGGGDDSSWCLGTQEWVKNMPYTSADRPSKAILFDMVGGKDARFHKEYLSSREAPGLVNSFWEMARRSGFADRFPARIGGGVVDDHLFINRAGIPCIDVIESYNDATGSFNPTWHTTDDNLANIDRQTLRIVAQTALNFLTNK